MRSCYTKWTFKVCLSLALAGCGPPPDLKQFIQEYEDPQPPVITSVQYTSQNATVSLAGPFLVALTIYADLATGICSLEPNSAEVTIAGTYDVARTDHLQLVGPVTQQITLSGGTYSLKTCVPSGSSAISFTAVSQHGKSSIPVSTSISLTPSVGTLAFGHPKYPNPGFRKQSSSATGSSLNGTVMTAIEISLSDGLQKSIASTGNLGFTMEIGFINSAREVSP